MQGGGKTLTQKFYSIKYIMSVPKESYLQVMLILVTIAEIIIFVVAAQLIKLRLKKNIFVF